MDKLFIIQFGCFLLSTVMALMLVMARFHLHVKNAGYESSRWSMFAAMVLLMSHYVVQMCFGFRAESDDVGAVINILFYTPMAFLLSYSNLRMATTHYYLRRYLMAAGVCNMLIYGTFLVGWWTYGSLHMPHALYLMGALFFVSILICSLLPLHDIRRNRKRLEASTSDDLTTYVAYMRIGVVLLCSLAVVMSLLIFYTPLLLVIGPLFFMIVLFYVVSFICLGFHIEALSQVLDTEPDSQAVSDVGRISDEYVSYLNAELQRWLDERQFSDSSLNMATMARQLGISQDTLSQYLLQTTGMTFRLWLSNLRLSEVKRMLLEHDDYTVEAIALDCGLSSRSWLQQKFKSATGMTPSEWKLSQNNLKS